MQRRLSHLAVLLPKPGLWSSTTRARAPPGPPAKQPGLPEEQLSLHLMSARLRPSTCGTFISAPPSSPGMTLSWHWQLRKGGAHPSPPAPPSAPVSRDGKKRVSTSMSCPSTASQPEPLDLSSPRPPAHRPWTGDKGSASTFPTQSAAPARAAAADFAFRHYCFPPSRLLLWATAVSITIFLHHIFLALLTLLPLDGTWEAMHQLEETLTSAPDSGPQRSECRMPSNYPPSTFRYE